MTSSTRVVRGVASFNHYAFHQVALGKDADQKTIAKHRHGADIPIHHRPPRRIRLCIGIGPISILLW